MHTVYFVSSALKETFGLLAVDPGYYIPRFWALQTGLTVLVPTVAIPCF